MHASLTGDDAATLADFDEQATAGQDIPAELARPVRVVEYTVPDRNPDGELIAVITTILDPHEIPAVDLAEAYHQCWEEESDLDEIKTDLRGRGEILRVVRRSVTTTVVDGRSARPMESGSSR